VGVTSEGRHFPGRKGKRETPINPIKGEGDHVEYKLGEVAGRRPWTKFKTFKERDKSDKGKNCWWLKATTRAPKCKRGKSSKGKGGYKTQRGLINSLAHVVLEKSVRWGKKMKGPQIGDEKKGGGNTFLENERRKIILDESQTTAKKHVKKKQVKSNAGGHPFKNEREQKRDLPNQQRPVVPPSPSSSDGKERKKRTVLGNFGTGKKSVGGEGRC